VTIFLIAAGIVLAAAGVNGIAGATGQELPVALPFLDPVTGAMSGLGSGIAVQAGGIMDTLSAEAAALAGPVVPPVPSAGEVQESLAATGSDAAGQAGAAAGRIAEAGSETVRSLVPGITGLAETGTDILTKSAPAPEAEIPVSIPDQPGNSTPPEPVSGFQSGPAATPGIFPEASPAPVFPVSVIAAVIVVSACCITGWVLVKKRRERDL